VARRHRRDLFPSRRVGFAKDGIEETLTAGGSSLSYDAASDIYTYVWKTTMPGRAPAASSSSTSTTAPSTGRTSSSGKAHG
jgi:hypothetical protein